MTSAGGTSAQKAKALMDHFLMPFFFFARGTDNNKGHNILIFILRNSWPARDCGAESIISITAPLFGANP